MPHRPAVPWWDETCTKLRRTTRTFYRRFKKNASLQTKSAYQQAVAKQRKYYKVAKRTSWICYINGISSKTPARVVWKKIKKLNGKYVPTPLPAIKVGDQLITDPADVSEKLAEHFASISCSKKLHSSEKSKVLSDISVKINAGQFESYNIRFALKELKEALSNTESTAPGEDNIAYEMIKHLNEPEKIFLLKINKIWETGILPKDWKVSLIIPVKKPNKNANEATSYRPIALTSCICKLMEKMVNARLVWYLEKNGLLSPFQYGFRKNRSTLDPLLRLSNQIQQGFALKRQTIGVFFDLEKAYDTTWRQGILRELCSMGIKGSMLKFLWKFLSDKYGK